MSAHKILVFHEVTRCFFGCEPRGCVTSRFETRTGVRSGNDIYVLVGLGAESRPGSFQSRGVEIFIRFLEKLSRNLKLW